MAYSSSAFLPDDAHPIPTSEPAAGGPLASRKQFLLLASLVLSGAVACDRTQPSSSGASPSPTATSSTSETATATATASPSATASASASETTSASDPDTSPSGEKNTTGTDSPLITAEQEETIIAQYSGQKPTRWGMDMPGILSTMDRDIAARKARELGAAGVFALTLDACGGPYGSQYDADIIDNLRATNTPATLFLNQRWIQANPSLARELRDDPLFEIANHGSRHCPLSVTGRQAYKEVGTANAR